MYVVSSLNFRNNLKKACFWALLCTVVFTFNQKHADAAYVNIGTRSRSALVNKVYVGFDTRFVAYRFGKGEKKDMIYKSNVLRRFENFDINIGWRITKNVALEGGYMYFGNMSNVAGSKLKTHGGYIDLVFLTPFLETKWFGLEMYLSAGGVAMKSKYSGSKWKFGGKAGLGLQTTIYGSLAVRLGAEYIYPTDKVLAKNGFLAGKLGIAYYFSL